MVGHPNHVVFHYDTERCVYIYKQTRLFKDTKINLPVVKVNYLKAKQLLPGQHVIGEGLWLNSLDYLCVCYTQRFILTVVYVLCYKSVIRNPNNISGYVYNRELITQPINQFKPLPLANSNFESDSWILFSNSCFWWCYQKYLSEYN